MTPTPKQVAEYQAEVERPREALERVATFADTAAKSEQSNWDVEWKFERLAFRARRALK